MTIWRYVSQKVRRRGALRNWNCAITAYCNLIKALHHAHTYTWDAIYRQGTECRVRRSAVAAVRRTKLVAETMFLVFTCGCASKTCKVPRGRLAPEIMCMLCAVCRVIWFDVCHCGKSALLYITGAQPLHRNQFHTPFHARPVVTVWWVNTVAMATCPRVEMSNYVGRSGQDSSVESLTLTTATIVYAVLSHLSTSRSHTAEKLYAQRTHPAVQKTGCREDRSSDSDVTQ